MSSLRNEIWYFDSSDLEKKKMCDDVWLHHVIVPSGCGVPILWSILWSIFFPTQPWLYYARESVSSSTDVTLTHLFVTTILILKVFYCKNVTHRSLSQRHTTDLLHRAYYTNFATLFLVTLPSTSTTYFQQQQQHARRHSSYISIRCLRLRWCLRCSLPVGILCRRQVRHRSSKVVESSWVFIGWPVVYCTLTHKSHGT